MCAWRQTVRMLLVSLYFGWVPKRAFLARTTILCVLRLLSVLLQADPPAFEQPSRMSDHSQPPASHQNTTSLTTQEQADTHRSLQQASQALELASNRIRQVRRSLLQLSESLPSNESITRIGTYDDLRPAHDALLLTGADGVQRPTSVRADRRRLRNATPLEAAVPSTPTGAAVQTEHTTGSAATALASRLDVLRSMINADPSATTRGMRVAARQAMLEQAQNTPDGSTTASQDHGELVFAPETPDPIYASIQARYERLQHLLSAGSRPNDFERMDDGDAPGPSLSITERITRRWGPSIPLNTDDVITTAALPSTPFAPPLPPANASRSGQSTPRQLPTASLPSDAATPSTASTLGGSVEQHRLLLQDILLADYPIFNPEQARDDVHFWRPGQSPAAHSVREAQEYLRHENNRIFQYISAPDTEANNQPSQSQTPSTGTDSDGSLTEERSSRRAWGMSLAKHKISISI